MGLLDRFSNLDETQTQGLLAAASQMLQNSGPSRTPVGFGQILGSGLEAYQGSTLAAKRRKMEEEQAKQMAAMRALQMQDMQGSLQDRSRNRDIEAQIGLAARNTGGDQDAFIEQVMQIDPMKGLALKQQFAKQAPQVERVEVAMRDGKPVRVMTFKDGTERVSAFDPKADMKEVRLGNRVQFTDMNRVQDGQQLGMGVDPDTVYSGNVSMRGQNMTDLRQREMNAITREGQQTQIINDPMRGPLLVNKGTGVVRTGVDSNGVPIQGEAIAKKEGSAKSLLPILDAAEKLIDGATGSYLGAGIDQGARVFGMSTGGSRNISQLKVMEGQIMMNQPRMEGPQSNMDVQLYRQMAALIGDPTVPNAQKKAAFGTLREITQRNSGNKTAPAAGGWSIKKVD